ncbi:hypothetical protein [Frankia sp. Cr1]|uniref:hypothetical protein n=1 Tax=Frankia sp. Cr1 TaxID=3073931 RepID=UPI002AD2A0FA|nr:hypothetical protein [Frankia sp. Cr1]
MLGFLEVLFGEEVRHVDLADEGALDLPPVLVGGIRLVQPVDEMGDCTDEVRQRMRSGIPKAV